MTGNSHLDHVFINEPTKQDELHYCINSASLKFISKEQMKAESYEEYFPLIK